MLETCGGNGTSNKTIVLRGTVKPKQTNADRIRSMTDEELAAFLLDIDVKANNYGYEAADGEPGEYTLPDDWLDWLKQEVGE